MTATKATIVGAVVLSVACSAGAPGREAMRLEGNKAIARGYLLHVLDGGEWDAWSDYFGGSVTFNGQPMSEGDLRAMAETFRTILPDLRLSVEEQIAEGDTVATRVSFTGTHEGDYMGLKASGQRVTFGGLVYDRIREGKVVETWHEMDIWGALLMASDE